MWTQHRRHRSTGDGPRYWEEQVRHLFISSAAALLLEFHIDGFRVDQTTSIRDYPKIHANGQPAERAPRKSTEQPAGERNAICRASWTFTITLKA